MSELLHQSKLSFASPSAIEHAVKVLSAARQEFLTTGRLTDSIVRPVILESWQRCVTGVTPSRRQVPLAVATESELRDLRVANEPILKAAVPILHRLTDFFHGSGYILGLGDAQGHLLEVVGDDAPIRWLEQIGLTPGGDWSEAAAGTNGIGTALALGRSIQVLGPEHYCDGWQDITCITALIRHPWTNSVIGVLDISGDYRLIRPFFTGFLAASAMEVKQNLKDLLISRRDHLEPFRFAFTNIPEPLGATPGDGRDEPSLQPVGGSSFVDVADDLQSRLDFQERRTRDAERLALAAGCVSASLDIEVTLKQVAEQAAHLLGLEHAAAYLLGEIGQAKMLRASSNEEESDPEMLRAMETLLRDNGLADSAFENGEPVVIDDIRAMAAKFPAALAGELQFRSLALLPMMSTHGVIGFIVAPRPTPYAWSADDLRLGLTLASQAATAIENARLFESLQRQHRDAQALNAVSQLLSTLPDPSEHLDLIVERVVVIMELDAGLVLLGGQQPDALAPAAHFGLSEALLPESTNPSWIGLREIAVRVAAAGEPMLICNETCDVADLAGLLRGTGFCDVMVVPVAVSGEILGVLLVGSYQHRGLTEANLTLFASIGQQLGLALKNAQLLRSVSETEALREVDQIKSHFLITVSHDLRSPLTAIRTSVESLLDPGGVQPAREEGQLLDNIADQSRRLGRMVDKLLDLSRIEAHALALDRDWIELHVLIKDAVAKFEELNCSDCVKVNLVADLPPIYADPDRLVQVLWNLLENAYKYGPPHSPIDVTAEWAGTEVLISVADRGQGIPIGERERIFQYFYRLDRDQRTHRQGSGLGLAICRGLVDAHGGRIWVEGRPGGGSIFRVALPVNYLGSLAALEGRDQSQASKQVP